MPVPSLNLSLTALAVQAVQPRGSHGSEDDDGGILELTTLSISLLAVIPVDVDRSRTVRRRSHRIP